MSVLTTGERSAPDKYQRKATQIKRTAVSSTQSLIQGVVQSLSLIWNDESPQLVLDALGTDAQELFELNTSVIEFLSSELVGKLDGELQTINDLLAKIQPYTVNKDGSVTITVVEEEEEEE